MKVADVMTKDPVAVDPATPLREVARTLVRNSISGLPVKTVDGRVLGVVSEADILAKERAAPRESSLLGRLLDASSNAPKHLARDAADAMTTPPVTIGPDRPVSDAASIMLDRQVHRLPVVETDGRLVGIVTRADLVRAFTRADEEIASDVRGEIVAEAPTAADVVTVTVADGEVTLEGAVPDCETAAAVATTARRVPGAVEVRSRLTWPLA